ncbi:MAG: tetratricopeptide repeat protein [Chitinophagaceae bacterium]
MRVLLTIWIILFANITFSQPKQSKKELLNADTLKLNKSYYQDSTNIRNYLDFIFDNFRTDIGNTISICTYLYHRSVEINNKKLMASALNIQGAIYALKNDYSKATTQYIEAATIFETINEAYSSAIIYNNLGLLYNNTNNKNLALQYFKRGIDIADANALLKPKALIYSNLANLYITQGELKNGLIYAMKADSLFAVLKMNTEQAVSSNLIGAIYFYQANYNKAVEYYKISHQLSVASGDLHSQNIALTNIGEVFALQKNPEVLNILESPEKYFTSINDYVNLQQVYSHYTSYYKNINDYTQTIRYLEKLRAVDALLFDSTQKKSIIFYQTKYETQQKENKILMLSKTDSIKSLQIVAQQLAISKNKYLLTQQKLALSSARLKIVEDSLQLIAQSKTILRTQLDASKKQEKINNLYKESLQQQLVLQEKQAAIKQKNATIGIVALIALISLLVGYGFYRKKQLEQQAVLAKEQTVHRQKLTQAVIEAEEAERKRIAADLHDGVGQLFSAVKMNLNGLFDRIVFNTPEDKFLAEKTMALVEESCKEIRIISHKMMPNFLLKSGIASDIRSFIEKIDEATLKINFETKGFKEQLEFNEEVILYRVIQELINNVIKHAKANSLELLLERSDKEIIVIVADNGIGFDFKNANYNNGLGLKNIMVRIAYLKGTITYSNNKPTGTLVKISVPIS